MMADKNHTVNVTTSNVYMDFVHTDPDTLTGKYLRLFWQPVYIGKDLLPGRSVPIRIMGENFTLYRGESGKPYVVASQCAHRLTLLSTGWVEGDCLRCFYHGWKYDGGGQCVEAPAEREGFAKTVRIRSCPTEEYLGVIFAYLGEGDPPPLPRYTEFEKEGILSTSSYVRDCNYFNNLESNMDEVHVAFVHRSSEFSNAGLNRDLPKVSGEETEYGIVKYGTRSDGVVRITPFYWPNALHIKLAPDPDDPEQAWSDQIAWRVPIDDERHASFSVNLVHITSEKGKELYHKRQEKRKQQMAGLSPAGEIAKAVIRGELHIDDVKDRPDIVNIQDYVAQVAQGVIADHERERLGRSDVLVSLLRKIWSRELKALAEGQPLKEWSVPEGVAATSGV